MIQLSEFFQYSFVLILKRKCLVGAGRVRCGESGIPSTIIYTRWSSRSYELGCDAPVFVPGSELVTKIQDGEGNSRFECLHRDYASTMTVRGIREMVERVCNWHTIQVSKH